MPRVSPSRENGVGHPSPVTIISLRGVGGNQFLLRSQKRRLLLSLLLSLKLWEVAAGSQEAATEEMREKPAVRKSDRVADPRSGKARRQ